MTERLDHEHGLLNNDSAIMPLVHIVEHPDPEGRRWQRALELLLEAGRARRETDSAA